MKLMKMMKRYIFAALALTALVSCHKEIPYEPEQWELDKYSNPDVRAGDDFYNFVNGRGLDGQGSDDWTVFARWKKHSEDFTDRIYDDTPGNPIPEMARLIELRDDAVEFNSYDRSVEDMYGRLGKIGRMEDISELPEAFADYTLMGYKLLMIEPVSIGGRRYGICPMVIPAKMCPELSREDIEYLGLDYDEYAAKYELASKAEGYILSKIQPKEEISMLKADPGVASDLCAMNEYIEKTRRLMTKAGGSALERFAARLGNKNPDFVVLDETSRLFFELLDKMDGSMVEEM
ncbi:MAG: hypothetical protein MJY56_06370, partial [Bacteroidales bacterium]|nr:hypothetical protein [Bacteroidales bacterium]